MRCRTGVITLITVILLLLPQQVTIGQEAVVYGVFFYSPSCRHCQQVIQNDWPTIQSEFGDQLQVLFINASTSQGSALMQTARAALQIESSGVPMLIIGTEAYVGSFDIPAHAPDAIRAGLQAGGIGLPAIPGIEAVYEAIAAQEQPIDGEETAPIHEDAAEALVNTNDTLAERLAADPVANLLALAILVLLLVSLFVTLFGRWNTVRRLQRAALVIISLVGMGTAVSLIAGANESLLIFAIAVSIFGVFAALFVTEIAAPHGVLRSAWRVPLGAAAGLAVAAYLASIELTQTEAICGLVGNCNVVQQSDYARLFGIPIGVIGIGGYLVILLLWVFSRTNEDKRILWLLRALAVFGVGFSTYLTFLEPFVIGATCLWCLSSALIMLVLLWMLFAIPDKELPLVAAA